jgi:outer membrane protein assembly factor BamB
MNMRPIFPICFVLLLSLMVGCSSQPAEPAASPSPAPVAEPVPAEPADVADSATEPQLEPERSDEPGVESPDEMLVESPTPVAPSAPVAPETEAESRPATPQVPAPVTEASDPYWPRFHGPWGDNISRDTGLLKEWPAEGPPLDWTTEGIGNGYSSVSLAHGLIYTAGNIDDKTMISAIGLDGQLRWQVENGEAWTKSYPGTRGTPTIDGDRLYHQSPVGNLICVVAKTGEPVWAVNTLETFDAENIEWALAESLLIDGEHVICCPGGKLASVAALNKRNGEIAWITESTGDKAGYGSPRLVEHGGLRMILTMTAKAVIGVDADSGRLLFRDPYETQYDVNAMMPLFHEGRVFVSTGYRGTGARLLQLNIQGADVSVKHVWESDQLDNQHGGVLLLDGYLYGSAHQFNGARWVCLDWQTGEAKWSERAIGRGSLTYADGLFYLYSERSRVGLARATPEAFELISEFELPPGGQGQSWAHPVVCGGRLYLRYDDRLHAYRVRSGD